MAERCKDATLCLDTFHIVAWATDAANCSSVIEGTQAFLEVLGLSFQRVHQLAS